eukprot:363901-Chlamydomonas_euryale.AAC.17
MFLNGHKHARARHIWPANDGAAGRSQQQHALHAQHVVDVDVGQVVDEQDVVCSHLPLAAGDLHHRERALHIKAVLACQHTCNRVLRRLWNLRQLRDCGVDDRRP